MTQLMKNTIENIQSSNAENWAKEEVERVFNSWSRLIKVLDAQRHPETEHMENDDIIWNSAIDTCQAVIQNILRQKQN